MQMIRERYKEHLQNIPAHAWDLIMARLRLADERAAKRRAVNKEEKKD
jgi:hypothetical protein